MEGVEAALAVPFLPQTLGYNIEVCDGCCKGRMDVKVPVCRSVSYHEACKIDCHHLFSKLGLKIVLIDLIGKVGHVDSSVTLA